MSNETLGGLIALEWDRQVDTIVRTGMHMTGLACTAIDNPHPREPRVSRMADFLSTDTLLFRDSREEKLHAFQQQHWGPLVTWFGSTIGPVTPTEDLDPATIAPQTATAMDQYLRSMHPWAFEGFVFAAESARSVMIATAMQHGHIDAEHAYFLANLETEFQVCSVVLFIHWIC